MVSDLWLGGKDVLFHVFYCSVWVETLRSAKLLYKWSYQIRKNKIRIAGKTEASSRIGL
jgi:hypothetical protein